jgi:plasmid stability protein
MASITVRNLDDNVKKRLRRRAAEHGRSLEAEVRAVLSDSVMKRPAREETGADLFDRIHARFKPLGVTELKLPKRKASTDRVPDFSSPAYGPEEK